MTLELPDWMEERPWVETVSLELPLPGLHDNTADWDRLERALEQKGFFPVLVSPRGLSGFLALLRAEHFRVSAVLGRTPSGWELIDVEPYGLDAPVLGLAVDLGTSQLVFYLVDLRSRRLLSRISVPNPQIPLGEDILQRIVFARLRENRTTLQRSLITTFNRSVGQMIEERNLPSSRVLAVTVCGNPAMSHFFLGLDPSNLCKEPYIPSANRFPLHHAADLDLDIHPRAPVYVFPNVGSYFGGDLLAGILAAGIHRSEDLSILVDVGTNAEVVLGNRDWLIACAGAAGPALEGGVVECGMMASPGAIDRVRIDVRTWEPSFRVLGGGKPRGICGSGLIDLVAEMFQAGILTIQGKINIQVGSPRVIVTDDGPAYIVAHREETEDGRDLVVTEVDVGIFLKSKAAMYTILNVITRKVGVTFQDLKHFYVAGAFGNRIDPEMAVRIGMLPDLPPDTFHGLGNTAGKGAVMLLLDRSLFHRVEEIRKRITYVELNVNLELMNEFRGALFLPHTDSRLFPSVRIPQRDCRPGESGSLHRALP